MTLHLGQLGLTCNNVSYRVEIYLNTQNILYMRSAPKQYYHRLRLIMLCSEHTVKYQNL